MEDDPKAAVEGIDPAELGQVAEHIDDPIPDAGPAAKPGGPVRFARMTGSSIAGRDAAGWVTDFLNAAYYRRPVAERDVDDMRLAFAILTTYWYQREVSRRLRLTDLRGFHRVYGGRRFDTEMSGRGLLNREQLLDGAAQLIGAWFSDAYGDPARRAWGIVFPSVDDRAAYDPARRLAVARLGKLTPESGPPDRQMWHTYPPVEMPSVEGVVGALTRPETWPDYASELGRFTPLRPGGLDGQTFEIEVAAGTESGRPIFTRGYVTITRLVTPDDPEALRVYFDELEAGLAKYGENEPPAVPEGGEPVVGFDLTTHEGHFMGAGHNRLILYKHDGRVWVRAAGTWDPSGRAAQHAFWGQGGVARLSMLHQLALQIR